VLVVEFAKSVKGAGDDCSKVESWNIWQSGRCGRNIKLKRAQYLTIMLFALVMGVFWGTGFTLSRNITTFRPQTYLDFGQPAIRNLAGPMRVLMPLALVSSLILLALLPKRSTAFTWRLPAFC
jgi:hypothetical protein